VQRGHNYFTDPSGALTAGVWTCTPMTTRLAPYPVNEFMLVLEGSVSIVDERGRVETMKAGDAFVIPKGLVCRWKQVEPIRKFYVIFDDPSGLAAADPSSLKVIRPEPHGPPGVGMEPMVLPDPSVFNGDVPTQHVHNYWSDVTSQLRVGVWDCTPMDRKPVRFGRNELMCLLEGSVTITDGEGRAERFVAGESFFIPKGMMMAWKSTEYVRKFYCIFEPEEASAQTVAA
jgi:uncharacterized cupin superfamily protein